MPSYRTIIDHLAELSPDASMQAVTTAALRLLPQGENVTDAESVSFDLEANTRAWATRLAFESLRGWSWPYWINLQTNPASGTALTALHQPLMFNTSARDLRPIVDAETGRFAGTLDSRGMFTPPGAKFSLEFWFRSGDDVIRPASIFDSTKIQFETESNAVSFNLDAAGCRFRLTARPSRADDFEFVSLTIKLTRRNETDSPAPHQNNSPQLTNALYVALRPYTANGIVPIHDLVYNSKGFWMCENRIVALFPGRPDISWASDATHGDAGMFVLAPPDRTAVRCPAGMATAISAFHIESQPDAAATFECIVPLKPVYPREVPFDILMKPKPGSTRKSTILPYAIHHSKGDSEQQTSPLLAASLDQLIAATDSAEPAIQQILLQRNHWIVPAVRALLLSDKKDCAARLLNYCALGLGRNGYLPQSHGRWGFAGQFLTALADFYRLGNQQPDTQFLRYTQIKAIGRWIIRKRREVSYAPKKPTGLYPPGITRNGIGREYQLADNIWGIEGLSAASWLARQFDEHSHADAFHAEAANFASQLNAAIHRELEYGIMQKVPGRLHRAFDPSSATELLDLALTREARELLAPADGWLNQVIDELTQPLDPYVAENSQTAPLLRMDERGLSPARHLMLALLRLEFDIPPPPEPAAFAGFTTVSGVWSEYLDIATRTGHGALHFDPEAAALYVLLTRKLKDAANNHGS